MSFALDMIPTAGNMKSVDGSGNQNGILWPPEKLSKLSEKRPVLRALLSEKEVEVIPVGMNIRSCMNCR